MELTISLPLPSSLIEEAAKNKQTLLQYAESCYHTSLNVDLSKLDGSVIPNPSKLKLNITNSGEPFVQINIDLRGIMRVVGGVSYHTKAKELIKLVLVDEGASFLLFQIQGKKALFYGGLNGTEFKRFLTTKPGQSFKYYQRTYTKLSMQEVKDLVDPTIIYYHDVPEKVEDPRKRKHND